MKAIYKQNRKWRGRSKYLLSVEAAVVKGEESLPVRLVFVRNRNHRKDWLVLVTTDMSLTAEEVIRIYSKRWGIEVFFKVCKSFLRLEKDCRSLSYDAMTAHVSIVFTRYMFLAVEQRECKDARSLGELFYLVEHENGHGVKIRAGRFIFTPIEGNVFDKRVEGFDLRPARSGTHLFMGRTYDGARQKVLGMSLTAYF